MTQAQKQLIMIIRCIACGFTLPDDFSVTVPNEVYQLAKSHDIAHFLGYAVDKRKILITDEDLRKAFRLQYLQAKRRVIILENEIKNIKEAFEAEGIDFVPLKGSVVRKLFPAEWMRVSGDIDILVRADELERAEQVLIEKLDYRVTNKGVHHNHVMAPSGFHIDLHFTLTEREGQAKTVLEDVWDKCSVLDGKKREYQMEDDMFYLFHIFHTATHFQLGGCGIRPILDTWLLNHIIEFDQEKRRALLQQAGLLQFAETMESVAEAWFSGTEAVGIKDIENYVFNGGLYGGKQKIAAAQAQYSSRLEYLIKRAFPPIKTMKLVGYPIVEKWKVLLPFCWIHRLIRGFVQGKGKLVPYELQKTKEVSGCSAEISEFFMKLGLS